MLKKALLGVRFATDAAVRLAVQKMLHAIPAKDFEKAMTQKWQERMQEYIINHRIYFEKVSIDRNVTDTDQNLF